MKMTEDEIRFIESLLGKPHIPGMNGPDAYDCWGVAQVIERRLFNREMPDIKEPPTDVRKLIAFIHSHKARAQWKRTDTPAHGQLVELAHGNHPFHIGVYLDVEGGGIIHSLAKVGVSWDREIVLKAAGWRKFAYHDWIG